MTRGQPPLGLACLAAQLRNNGHRVRILDMNVEKIPLAALSAVILDFQPQIIGFSTTTPLFNTVSRLATHCKKLSKDSLIVVGGPHPSAMLEEVLQGTDIDCALKGEGEKSFLRLVENGPSDSIDNLAFRKGGKIAVSSIKEDHVEDLDSLPFPAYDLLDVRKYGASKLMSRRSPVANMESSRGCFGRCIYCSKKVHGFRVRMKSPLRVVDECEYLLSLGFKEIHFIDDIFTANKGRVVAICEEILRRGLSFPWYPRGGLRVDTLNKSVLQMMKRAGCYRIPLGIESGSQRLLDLLQKGITLEQAREAVAITKETGFETECYFMIGLPTETDEEIRQSIKFAIELDPDYAKFAITIPLPGTLMFRHWWEEGKIKSKNWDDYTFATPNMVYDHDNLSWDTIQHYYQISHRSFYLRAPYLLKMLRNTLKKRTFFYHLKGFFKTQW